MLYGMYLSATGVMTNTYRQDVISNNLANAETPGFRKQLTEFRERRPASQEIPGKNAWTNPLLDKIGGGTLVEPTVVDSAQGDLEDSGNPLDVGINGKGYFTVDDHGTTRLTRNGQFMTDVNGFLISANGHNNKILDVNGQPIRLDPRFPGQTNVNIDGTINQGEVVVARLRVVDVPDQTKLKNEGAMLLSYPDLATAMTPSDSRLQGGKVERSNVDPTVELTSLMETQRLLEANANMIKTQDDTLDKLVNIVGKIS